ncbi:MAG: hypothetical protein KatS3mg035_1031 [Bacteroidia bacterium]|nr:MAG: hypothetical protein KatS3mg035_1031 [Bacteroidia bacterium]
MVRKYREFSHPAETILMEVSMKGKSSGWAGSTEEFEFVKNKLTPFNVIYACDFTGTWKLKK